MSFEFNGTLPKFFIIDHTIDDENGNLGDTCVVACVDTVKTYNPRRTDDVKRVYAWTRNKSDRVADWLWTEKSMHEVSEVAKNRLETFGYEPVMIFTGHSDTDTAWQVHAKIDVDARLEIGDEFRYLRYFDMPNSCGQFHIKTVTGVYEYLAAAEKPDYVVPTREYIFGLEHLYERLHDKLEPIRKDAVLVILADESRDCHRREVVEAALELGFYANDLRSLIDLMASGRAVFNTKSGCYIESFHVSQNMRVGPVILTADEFAEYLTHNFRSVPVMTKIEKLYRACAHASSLAYVEGNSPFSRISDRQIPRVD